MASVPKQEVANERVETQQKQRQLRWLLRRRVRIRPCCCWAFPLFR